MHGQDNGERDTAGLAVTGVAACPTPCGLQTGNTDVQVATPLRTVASLRLRRMQVGALRRHHVRYLVCVMFLWPLKLLIYLRVRVVIVSNLLNLVAAAMSENTF